MLIGINEKTKKRNEIDFQYDFQPVDVMSFVLGCF